MHVGPSGGGQLVQVVAGRHDEAHHPVTGRIEGLGDRRGHRNLLRPLLGHRGRHADPLTRPFLGKDVVGQGPKPGAQGRTAGTLAPDLRHHQERVVTDLEGPILHHDPIGRCLHVLHHEDEHGHGGHAEQDQATKHEQDDLHKEYLSRKLKDGRACP